MAFNAVCKTRFARNIVIGLLFYIDKMSHLTRIWEAAYLVLFLWPTIKQRLVLRGFLKSIRGLNCTELYFVLF